MSSEVNYSDGITVSREIVRNVYDKAALANSCFIRASISVGKNYISTYIHKQRLNCFNTYV